MPEKIFSDEFFRDLAVRASDRMMEELPSEEELSRQLSFSPAFERKMELLLANPKQARAREHRAWRVLAIAAVVLIMLISALMSVSAVREAVFKFFTELYEKYIVVWYAPEADTLIAPEIILEFREPAYIPPGYAQISVDKTEFFHVIRFANSEGWGLLFEQAILDSTLYAMLIEEATEQEQFEINGTLGVYRIVEDDELSMVWTDNSYAYKILGSIDVEQAIEMARSTK